MIRNRKQHSITLALATLVAGAVTLSAPSFAGSAHSTRPPSGSSGGSVEHSAPSSPSGPSYTPAPSSGSHESSHGDRGWTPREGDRTRVEGESRWHSDRDRGGHRRGYGGYGGYGYYGAYWRGGYNDWYSNWYWPTAGPWSIGWWGYWGPYANYYDTPPYYGTYGTRVYPNDEYGAYGALDLDLSPERAEVYVNGQRIGVADDYDGFPTYLWLEQGVYDVVFYAPGYETVARQYVIRPGLIVDVEDTMAPGQSVRPEDLPAKTHDNRDARLRQNREIEQDAARGMRPGMRSSDRWRDRGQPLDRAPITGDGDDARRPTSEDARVAPARLKVNVEPGDASVYLDGRFVGTGAEIEQLPNGLLIDAGPHRIEAVRPGRRAVTKEFTAEPGGDSEVDLTLSD